MRTETRVHKFFQYDELSDNAKQKAREWFREGCDPYWQETVFDDAIACASILGIEIDRGDGVSSLRSKIYFSGFSCQGDGACFEGTYSYKRGAAKAIRSHTGNTDETLARIADELQTIQKQAGYGLTAEMKHRGHYSHSGCMSVEVGHKRERNPELWEAQLTRLMREFADWIYRQLEKEYNYQNSDDTVAENIRANEYEFSEDGKRAV